MSDTPKNPAPSDHVDVELQYRPHEFDDWGMIRNSDGSMFATVRRPLSQEEADAHRTAKTDPFEDLARKLIAAHAPKEHGEAHSDDLAVHRFFAAMKAKLAKKRAQGYGGWDRPDECTIAFLSELLRRHVEKGDPIDVANFAMMIHQRGGWIAPAYPETARRALRTALDHIEHMAAWIGKQNAGYSFESLGEDMQGMRDALENPASQTHVDPSAKGYPLAECAPTLLPAEPHEEPRPLGLGRTATSAFPQTACSPAVREIDIERGQHVREGFSDACMLSNISLEQGLSEDPDMSTSPPTPSKDVLVAGPVGYVTKDELTKLRLGVSCVDLFSKVVPTGFEMVPLYEHPPVPHVMGEPAYYAVHSKTGMHIGLWPDKAFADEVLREYDGGKGGKITPLYTAPPTDALALTGSQSFLLEWLSKEDFSSYGECKGEDLDALVRLGLAEVGNDYLEGSSDWAPVSLTDAGRAALAAPATEDE